MKNRYIIYGIDIFLILRAKKIQETELVCKKCIAARLAAVDEKAKKSQSIQFIVFFALLN